MRSVQFGDPPRDDKTKKIVLQHFPMPYVYVTTKDNIQSTSYPFGISNSDSQNQVTVQYEIVLVAHTRDQPINSQTQLYSLMKNLRNVLTSNPTFTDPSNPGTDPIFTRSIINQVPWNPTTKGALATSISYTLTATIGSEFSVDFPTIGNVILLSKPNNPEGVIFSDNRLQSDPNRVITPNGDFGAIFAEYESTPTLDDAFRAKFGLQETITINRGTSSRDVDVVYIEINPTARFDEIERTVLHMEIVKV